MNKRHGIYLLAASVALITLAVYLPSLWNDFVSWDDGMYVYENKNIRSFGPAFFRWAFSDYATTGNWHPLTWISYAVDHAVWGLDPFGYHLTAILLHALNTFLVVLLAIQLYEASAGRKTVSGILPAREKRMALIAGTVAGMVFGIHPLHVESAAWIADRRDLLCTLFFLLSISSYVKYAVSRGRDAAAFPLKATLVNKQYLAAIAFMVLSVSSKSMAVTLPAVLLLLDWYPLERTRSKNARMPLVAEKMPFVIVSIVLAGSAYMAQQAYNAVVPLDVLPAATRILVAVRSLAMYLRNMAFPADLMPFYPYPENITPHSLEFLIALAVLCMLTGGSIVAAKKNRIFLAVWLYYLITLAPVIGMVQIGSHSMADRYVYLPSIGPFLLAGAGAARLWEKADRLESRGRAVRWICAAAAAVLLATLSWATVKQISVWKNTVVLWSYVIEREPTRIPIAYNNRGLAFKEEGQLDRALSDLTRAVELAPSHAGFYNNRGSVRGAAGRTEQAIEDFTKAIELDPDFAAAYSNRGLKYYEMGKDADALSDLHRAIQLAPSSGDAYLNRGLTYEHTARFQEALEDYSRAIAIDPSDYLAWSYRGIVQGKLGRLEHAIADQTQALALKPDYADAYLQRGGLYRNRGDSELASHDYKTACSLGSAAGCRAFQDQPGQERP